MKCVSPLTITHNGIKNTVPCGKCLFCLENRRNDWTFRLLQELKVSKSASFITFTYDEENLPINANYQTELNKIDLQLFFKRLRKANEVQLKKNAIMDKTALEWPSIKYYACGEYGEQTMRPHYHAIIFNITKKTLLRIDEIWQKGHVSVGTCTNASIHYTTKYMINKEMEVDGRSKPFSLMSKNLGKNYLKNQKTWHRKNKNNYVLNSGMKQKLPRYYRDKIWSSLERSSQAINNRNQMDAQELKMLEELRKHHPNPLQYQQERINCAHSKVHTKSKKRTL